MKIRIYIITLFIVLLAASPAGSGSMLLLGAGKATGGGGGGGSISWTATANPAIQVGTANPQSFTTVNIGTAAANRYVIVCIGQPSNGPVGTVFIGGVTATQAVDSGAANNRTSIWYANVTSGTTATINVNLNAPFPSWVGISVGTIRTGTPAPANTATQFGGLFNPDPQVTTSSLTIPSSGIGVICASASSSTNATPTYNNWIKDYDNQIQGTAFQILLGHLNVSGTPSITGFAFQDLSIAAASWGP